MENNEGLFPTLPADMIERLKAYGQIEKVSAGTVLVEPGDKSPDFFVVLSGAIRISDPTADDRLIAEHTPGNFTGDSDMLSQRRALFRSTMSADGEVLRIPASKLKELVKTQPEISDILLNAFLLRRERLIHTGGFGARLIGSRYSADTFRIREFFSRNQLPYTWHDLEHDPEAVALLEKFQIRPDETPLLLGKNRQIYKNPSLDALAQCFGISDHATDVAYDVVVVGAGPGGLAASVYAASEGLEVLTVDSVGPGGQAGTSSKIENYLGFPTGISGQELAARAYAQVQKFGGTVATAREVSRLRREDGVFRIGFSDGEVLSCKSVVIATGARYRKLELPELARFEGKGVYYGATVMEAQTCSDEAVVIVGGGNSAGQAAVFLSRIAHHVHLLIRGEGLEASMSQYLIQRIAQTPNITLHPRTQITALQGDQHLEAIRCDRQGESFEIATQHVFSMIGALPCTDWVRQCVVLDPKGFVVTGIQLTPTQLKDAAWPLERPPSLLETSVPGVYAVGDVRSQSTKRVASAVGEGAMCISFVHQFLSAG